MPLIGSLGAISAKGFGFSSSKKGIQYVGSSIVAVDGSASGSSFSLTTLTGGIASAPAEGDLVLIFVGIGSAPNTAPGPSVSGYATNTVFGRLNSTTSVRMGIFYKFMTSTPDTSVVVGNGGNSQFAFSVYAVAFRGVDTGTPFDVTTTATTGTSTLPVPGITPITPGAYAIQSSTYAHTRGTVGIETVGVLNPKSAGFNDTYDVSSAAGYIIWSSGIIPATTWAFGASPATTYASAGASVALRPKP